MAATCKWCDATIKWVRTVAGKAIPLDRYTVDAGNIVLSPTGAAVHVMPKEGVRAFVTHWATCPKKLEARAAMVARDDEKKKAKRLKGTQVGLFDRKDPE